MKVPDQKPVIDFFHQLLKKYGKTCKALAYGSVETQRKKFQALIEIGNLQGKKILDVGCGFGDLALFIKEKGYECDYTGIDIAPEIIQAGKELHPQLNILVADILSFEGNEIYDFVLSTGFNCVLTGHNWETLSLAMKRMYELAKEGVAIGMVSSYREPKDPSTYYASPEEVFKLAMSLTKRVILRHDYLPHDFTIYLYKKDLS